MDGRVGTSDDRTGRRGRVIRLGGRSGVAALLLGAALLGLGARAYHLVHVRPRLLAELRAIGVGPLRSEPTVLGQVAGFLPVSANTRLRGALGDRRSHLFEEPTEFSAVLIREGRVEEALARLRRFGRLKTLRLPAGLSEGEMGRIREGLPDVRLVVDPRFRYGQLVEMGGGP